MCLRDDSRFVGRVAGFLVVFVLGLSGCASSTPTPAVASGPVWNLPFPTGTRVSIGPKGLHGENFGSMQDDRTQRVFTFNGKNDPDSLDVVLEPEQKGTAAVAVTPLAQGKVLAVWQECQVVLIDHLNGFWSIYLHLKNILVSSGEPVEVTTKLGYPTTELPHDPNSTDPNSTDPRCGNVSSDLEHVHFAFLTGAGTRGSYDTMAGKVLCGHTVQSNGLLQGLSNPFTIPSCPAASPSGGVPTATPTPRPAGIITLFPLSPDSYPGAITAGPDGNVWFTEVTGARIGRITPSGQITEFPVHTPSPDEQIGWSRGITTGPDGNLWFTDFNGIGRITPTGQVTEFPEALGNVITTGPDGNLWFAFGGDSIGRITPNGQVTNFPLPSDTNIIQGITAGPDGNIWFTGAYSMIWRITPQGQTTSFPVPDGASGYRITAGPDGNLWFTTYTTLSPRIGRITPQGQITWFPLPSDSSADAITSGPDGNLWFTGCTHSNNGGCDAPQIARMTPQGQVTWFPVPTSVNTLIWISAGPDGNLWFTGCRYNSDTQKCEADMIGRITSGK